MALYNRIAEVIIGNSGFEEALSISKLRIIFDIKKTKTIIPNTAKIQIYNVAESTRNKIQDRKSWVLVRAGYSNENGLQDIYKGTIIRSSHEKTRPDVILTIEAQDGIGQQTKRVSLGYPGGTSAKTIIEGLLKKMELPMKNSSVNIPDKIFTGGFSTVGTIENALTRVCRVLGLEWSIQNEEVLFTQINGSSSNSITHISPNTGMIGSPLKVANVVPNVDQANVPGADFLPQLGGSGSIQFMVGGYKIKSLLKPTIEPKDKIALTSFDVPEKSIYIVETVVHSGDTYGADWTTTMDAYEEKSK